VSIGSATDVAPTITLDAPAADPHYIAAGDPVTFSGTVSDDEADELLVVISSSLDDTIHEWAFGDPSGSGDWTIDVPAGVFGAGDHPVSVTVYDAAGIADSTSITISAS